MRRLSFSLPLLIAGLAGLTACAPRVPGPGPKLRGYPVAAYALRWVDIKEGKGPVAVAGKPVSVHYTGWLKNGKKFDSSLDRGQPITFVLGAHQVIVGWDTGFQGMRVGGKRRLLIPYQLAYGEAGRDPIPPKADLTFDIELVAVDGQK